jgi:protein ImuA
LFAMTRSSSSAPLLPRLRARVAVLQPVTAATVPFGDARVDAHLPGGLALGQMHEIGAVGIEAEIGALAAGFAACLLARLPDAQQAIVWIAPSCDLYPPGLLGYGLDPARLLLVQTMRDAETLQAMEAALREGGVAAVVGEVGRLDRVAARRLQLACGKRGVTGFVLRRWPHGCRQSVRSEGNAAATRWRLQPEPSQAEPIGEPGPPRWRVELLHARDGRPSAWIMEQGNADDAATTHPLRVVAALGDHPATPPASRRRLAE